LSYSRKDIFFVHSLERELDEAEIPHWIDKQIPTTAQDWRTHIDQKIDGCDLVLLVMSPEANESLYVTYEWAYALGKQKPIFMLLYKKTPGMHKRLDTLQYLDFTDHSNPRWAEMVTNLKSLLSGDSNSLEGMPLSTEDQTKTQFTEIELLLVEAILGEILQQKHLRLFMQHGLITHEQDTKIRDYVKQKTAD